MKNIFAFLILLSTIQVFSQTDIPCKFSWSDASTTSGTSNFITKHRSQPYQGPCMAFAFNAAIETQYAITTNNNDPNITLSDAYLDFKVWDARDYKEVLESGFKIPIHNYNLGLGNLNGFPPPCQIGKNNCYYKGESMSFLRSDVMKCITSQRSYSINKIVGSSDFDITYEVECKGSINNYLTVDNVNSLTNIDSEDALKLAILTNGPVIIKINGNNNVLKFRKYDVLTPPEVLERLGYHAFTIIGWDDNSRWIIKDSWPRMSGIKTTKPKIDLLTMIQNNSVELYQVSGIRLNGTNSSGNPAVLIPNSCVQNNNLTLSQIYLEDLHTAFIGGYLYSKFRVNSNVSVDRWVWGIDYPNGALKRSQINNSTSSSVLLSPTSSGMITIFVHGYKNGKVVTQEKRMYLANGESGGMY